MQAGTFVESPDLPLDMQWRWLRFMELTIKIPPHSTHSNFRLHVQKFAYRNQNQLCACETIRCFINSLTAFDFPENGMQFAQQLCKAEIRLCPANASRWQPGTLNFCFAITQLPSHKQKCRYR
ncbi:MAG: hypothetical protein DMG65_04205 [Candidatus Angelobacter sp. Gp1-AA117]|nr:MAG: hypothetical protein DMG65_04205 [Candidatus Angelobacter sp. Gp1-AA117]